MSVHFVYRCHYAGPAGMHVKTFDSPSVLDWFRSIWRPIPDDDAAFEHAEKLLGFHVYSFGSLFRTIAEGSLPPPRSAAELSRGLEAGLYVNELTCERHAVQVYTDDDDLEMAIYVFDDHFARKYPRRTAFLMHEGWELPAEVGPGGFRPAEKLKRLGLRGTGEGTTYAVFLTFYASDNLDYLPPPVRFDGVRLPDFPRHLLTAPKPDEDERELLDLREQLLAEAPGLPADERAFLRTLRDAPGDESAWMAYSDWLQERGELPAGPHLLRRALDRIEPRHVCHKRDPAKNRIQADEHLTQGCLHVRTESFRRTYELYHRWIFFDDLWASAHPDLANSLLRYASRWDVLSGGRPEE